MPVQNQMSCAAAHATTLFQNAIVKPAFGFKKYWVVAFIVIVADPKFEPIVVAVQGPMVGLKIVGI